MHAGLPLSRASPRLQALFIFRGQILIQMQPGQPAAHPDMPVGSYPLRVIQRRHRHIDRLRAMRGHQRHMRPTLPEWVDMVFLDVQGAELEGSGLFHSEAGKRPAKNRSVGGFT